MLNSKSNYKIGVMSGVISAATWGLDTVLM